MKRTILCHLCGGLGNQLFQYAAAKSLSKKIRANLYLDCSTGFFSDREFRRQYALKSFATEYTPAKGILPILIFKSLMLIRQVVRRFALVLPLSVGTKYFNCPIDTIAIWPFQLIYERSPVYSDISGLVKSPITYLFGYWQSHHYFPGLKEEIWRDFQKFYIPNSTVRVLGERLFSVPTLAVGLRFYEESPMPQLNCNNGEMKSLAQISANLNRVVQSMPGVRIAIFCVHRSPLISQLELPPSVQFLTGDDGITSAEDTLWLMSNCQHHFFLNSSLYWWAASFSEYNFAGTSRAQNFYASDNFINQSSYPSNWCKF